eukprot:EG_transcript_10298
MTARAVAQLRKAQQRGRGAQGPTVPVDFGARQAGIVLDVELGAGLLLPDHPNSPVWLPEPLLHLCTVHNVAFSLRRRTAAISDGAAGGEAPYDAVPLLLVHAAQTRGVAHTVTKVAEPEQTLDGVEVVGGILEIAGMKMHVTVPGDHRLKRHSVVHAEAYSADLAKAAHIQAGQDVLDVFFGLGYGSMSAVHTAGARSVCTFERSQHVLRLAAANPSPFPFHDLVRLQPLAGAAPQASSPPMAELAQSLYGPSAWLAGLWQWCAAGAELPLPHQLRPGEGAAGRVLVHNLDITKAQFWSVLKGKVFDAAIIDPPRWHHPVARLYSVDFLHALAQHIAVGASVAFYVPNPEAGGHAAQERALADVLRRFPDTVRATGCFAPQAPVTKRPEIRTYRRVRP